MLAEGNKYLKLDCRTSALRTIFERDNLAEIGSVTVISLLLEMRLLYNFTSRIFIPRIGRFDWVSENDLAFKECIIKGKAINLPLL